MIDEACRLVIEAERHGIAVTALDDAPHAGPPKDFLVHGLAIPADSHSQLVSDGGGLKSLLLLLILGEMAKRGIPVLYVDWEWNAGRHKARKERLFGRERLETLYYLRCHNSLAVEHSHIQRICDERAIQFLALDSIGAACDGKLADDDVARAYNRVLDDLPPTVSAAHVPKTALDPHADLKAFGSAFFHNYARMTWTVRKQADSDGLVTVLVAPYKQNDGTRSRAVGLEFTFTPERIDVRAVDPLTVDGLAESLPLATRMIHQLKRGPQSFAELATALNAKVDSIIKAANRGRTFTRVPSADGITRVALRA